MNSSRSLLLALTSLLVATTAFATDQTSSRTPSSRSAVPAVTKAVNPSMLPRTFNRRVLKVSFSLDEQGQPQNIQVLSEADDEVKQQVVTAFKDWRFNVASVRTGAVRYVLPLDIIPQV